MKRIIAALTALTVIIGLGASCQKEMENRQETSGNGLKITATIANNGTKVSYQEDGTTPKTGLKSSWQKDDIIIGFDDDGNTYGYKVTEVSNNGVATLARITEGDNKGTATADPADGTQMYMFYAPGRTPDKISGKSLTVSLATQAKDVVPALMMAQATVTNGSLSLQFNNKTAIIGVKAPVMADKNKSYTSLALSGSTGLNTEVKFDLDGDNSLKVSYQNPGTITKELDFKSNETTGVGPDVIYIVACPAAQQDLYFKFNGTEEYFNVKDATIAVNNYYRLEAPGTEKQKFTLTAGTTTNGSISFKNGSTTITSGSSVVWGTEVTITAAPSEGYELATLTYNDGTDHDIKATGTFTMPKKDVTVSGTFQLKNYDISADGTESSGTYTVEGGTYTITKDNANVTMAQIDDVIKVTPTPNTGYSGGTVTVKKTDTDEEVTFDDTNNTFEMPAADVTITVSFTHDEYDITGTVTPDGTSGSVTFKKSGSEVTKAYYGDEITVVDAPATGYELESITAKDADNADVPVTGGKFTMPEKDVTVTVAFKKKVFSFSVDNSTKVVFAPGNLYAKNKGTEESPDWEWDFYGEQYQFHPKSMEVSSKNGEYRYNLGNDTEIDMFCWGYNETNSTDPLDQSKNSTFIDWGTISGLPDAPYSGGWRTLSSDEWTYLLNTRTSSIVGSTTNARYVKCSVSDGTKDYLGLMIFPDTFTWPTKAGDAPKYINNGTVRWDYVSNYNNAQFKELKKAGVVFLPAAGYRTAAGEMKNVGSQVYYGSCTRGNKSSSSFHLTVTLGAFSISCYTNDRADGQSVRLVSTVQ